MKINMLVNARGKVCVIHDERFSDTPAYVKYNRTARKVVMIFEDGTSLEMTRNVPDNLHAYLVREDVCMIIRIRDAKPIEGWEVPLLVGYQVDNTAKTNGALPTESGGQEAWWEDWRATDYSWEGLANKSWDGWSVLLSSGAAAPSAQLSARPQEEIRRATLQDYWRGEEAHLIEGDGKRWTRAHCPLVWGDGAPTPKANWSDDERAALKSLLQQKLKGAGVGDEASAALDSRAQLQGIVTASSIEHPVSEALSANFDRAALFSWSHTRSRFAKGVSFRSTLFAGEANFGSATFEGDASFTSAVFASGATFNGAAFEGATDFASAVFFEEASFARCKSVKSLSFVHAIFQGAAKFNDARIGEDAWFSMTQFRGPTHFDAMVISGRARLEGAEFLADARFNRMRFQSAATFSGIVSAGAFEMRFVEFGEVADFTDAHFISRMSFASAQFRKVANFERIAWPTNSLDWHSAFDQAVFFGPASFRGSAFKALAAFDGATFAAGLHLDDASEAEAKRAFMAEARAALRWREKSEVVSGNRKVLLHPKQTVREGRERRLKELERGCRVLKLAMSSAANKTREQMLYRFELMARRAQRDTAGWEKICSYLYGWASDYGASMARPFVALAVLLVGFAAGFYVLASVLGVAGEDRTKDLWDALELSWSNTFRPLSVLSDDLRGEASLAARLLRGPNDAVKFGVKALATLQSLLSILLAFLFALAVRRRFQID